MFSSSLLLRPILQPSTTPSFPQPSTIPQPQSLAESIKSLCSLGRLSAAFTSFSLLLLLHRPPSHLLLRSISSLLFSSTTARALSAGKQLHAQILTLGFLHSPSLLPRLTQFYTALNLLADAQAVAELSTDPVPWNLLIIGYLKDGLPTSALTAYRRMVHLTVDPDSFTYPSILRACSETLDLDSGKDVHESIQMSGMGWNLFVSNALVAMYAKCGDLVTAKDLFDEMPEKDVVSWNSMISGYASKGMWKEAFKVFERMQSESGEVNSVTWNTIAGGKMQMGRYKEALALISQMISSGVGVDFVTMVVGLNACSRMGSVRLGKEIHGFTVRHVFDGIQSVTNALITMYSRCKDVERAYLLFRMAGVRSVITWNTMMAGFAIFDMAEETSLVFRDMVWLGIQPNYVSIVTILSLCGRVTNLQHGQELHCYITKQEFRGYRLLWNSLIDLYSKSGKIAVARKIFDTMIDRDEVSYTSMIAGYGMEGEGMKAVELFDEMIASGIKPDHITMVAVLSACSHSGLVIQGQMLFDRMGDTYGIEPHMEHFSCMVDLFARAGMLQKAEEMLNRTPFHPTAAMLAALLGACLVHRNTDIGKRVARMLLEMRTDNAGHYVLIANMYAATESWEELATVRSLMRKSGVRKAPGCSWVDLGNGSGPFVVGDRSSPLAPEIYVVLEDLTRQTMDVGYMVNEDLGFDEDIKGRRLERDPRIG